MSKLSSGRRLERILKKCRGSKVDGCWIYLGFKNRGGYGRTKLRNRQALVHRVTYEILCGDVKDGFELHHLCNTPSCVNPYHLRQVTHKQNMIDFGTTNYCYQQARKTHCKRGHEFTIENTILVKTGRNCRECMQTRSKKAYERRKNEVVFWWS